MTIRIMLVDDHRVLLEALSALLQNEEDMLIVGTADNAATALALAGQIAPDVVVMDIGMPDMNGAEATRLLIAAHPQLKVVGLSAYADKRFVLEMLNAGATGYVVKSAAVGELSRAIRAVAQGQTFLCAEVSGLVVDVARRKGAADLPVRLGRREREVLRLLAEGLTSPQIAGNLYIAVSTVEVHRRNIMSKLNLHNIAELTKYAIREGLTSP